MKVAFTFVSSAILAMQLVLFLESLNLNVNDRDSVAEGRVSFIILVGYS